MDYTGADGVTVTSAYWVPTGIRLSPIEKTCYLTFNAYKDSDAVTSGETFISGAEKDYVVQGADYDTYFADTVFQAGGTDLTTQAFAYADSLQDSNGVSFFNAAVDAPQPLPPIHNNT